MNIRCRKNTAKEAENNRLTESDTFWQLASRLEGKKCRMGAIWELVWERQHSCPQGLCSVSFGHVVADILFNFNEKYFMLMDHMISLSYTCIYHVFTVFKPHQMGKKNKLSLGKSIIRQRVKSSGNVKHANSWVSLFYVMN